MQSSSGGLSPDFSVQIAYQGRRVRFPVDTPNREAAARKAQSIFLSLTTAGWEATLAKFKPKAAPKEPKSNATTVGNWLEGVRETTDFRPSTFTTYAQCLRQVVAEIADIGDQPVLAPDGQEKRDRKGRIVYQSRFDYKQAGGTRGEPRSKSSPWPC